MVNEVGVACCLGRHRDGVALGKREMFTSLVSQWQHFSNSYNTHYICLSLCPTCIEKVVALKLYMIYNIDFSKQVSFSQMASGISFPVGCWFLYQNKTKTIHF